MMTHATHVALTHTHTHHSNPFAVPPSLSHSHFRVFIALTLEGTDGFGTLSNHKFKVCHLCADRQRLSNKASVSGQMRLQPPYLPTPPTACTQLWALPPKMQMNDATEPLKIIIGAAVTTAAQRKIYFLIFNGVNAYRKTEKRKTKKAMQMQLSAEQNVFEMKSLRSGAARREASGNGNRYQHFASISISYILLIYIQFSVFFLGIFVLL